MTDLYIQFVYRKDCTYTDTFTWGATCKSTRLFSVLRNLTTQETRLALGLQVNFPESRRPKNDALR